jgi:hypothetical protein
MTNAIVAPVVVYTKTKLYSSNYLTNELGLLLRPFSTTLVSDFAASDQNSRIRKPGISFPLRNARKCCEEV